MLTAGAIVLVAVFGVWWGLAVRRDVPKPIRSALAKMPSIPPGIRQREIFSFLSLPEPKRALYRFIEGRTGTTQAQYEIGFGKKYILECEGSKGWPPEEGKGFDDSVLYIVRILKRDRGAAGAENYHPLTPAWTDEESTSSQAPVH